VSDFVRSHRVQNKTIGNRLHPIYRESPTLQTNEKIGEEEPDCSQIDSKTELHPEKRPQPRKT
jgi:hypothetical protein